MKKIFIYIFLFLTIFLFLGITDVKADKSKTRTCSYAKIGGGSNCTADFYTTMNYKSGNKGGYDANATEIKSNVKKSCPDYTITYADNFLSNYNSDDIFKVQNRCIPNIYYKVDGKKIKIRLQKKDGYKKSADVKVTDSTPKTTKGSREGKVELDTDIWNDKKNDEERIDILTAVTTGQKYTSCEQLLSDGVVSILKKIFLIIQIITPILLIIFTMLDFTKAVASSDKEALNKAFKKFIKRAAIAAAIFLIPTFVTFMLDITGISDGVCGLS